MDITEDQLNAAHDALCAEMAHWRFLPNHGGGRPWGAERRASTKPRPYANPLQVPQDEVARHEFRSQDERDRFVYRSALRKALEVLVSPDQPPTAQLAKDDPERKAVG